MKPPRIIICEGEFDRLVLEARGFAAVTSTGGAGVFRREWAEAFREIPDVFVCFDRDEAGKRGAERVARLIPQARIVALPEEVGDGGDVTDFFVRLGKSREDLLELLAAAEVVPAQPSSPARPSTPSSGATTPIARRIADLKREFPVAAIIGQYVKLRPSGTHFSGLCPFHEDRRPSFVVYPETWKFHCFGCGRGGDAIRFIMELQPVSFCEALEILERTANLHGAEAA